MAAVETVEVDTATRKQVAADQANRVRVTNKGSTVYYGTDTVSSSSNDGSVTDGSNVILNTSKFFISAGKSVLSVESLADYTRSGGLPVTTSPRVSAVVASSLTYGTDSTPVATEVYIAEIHTKSNVTLTGVEYLIGSVGGTDKAIAVLYDTDGKVLANSATAGTTVGTTATWQQLAFTSTYQAKGPQQYFIGISLNGNTARLRTIPVGPRLATAKQTGQTFGTLTTITAPTTFTADVGPVAGLY
jgi:hypothetical protein